MNIAYLEKVPKEYFCVYKGEELGVNRICKPEDFCKDPNVLSYTPNMDLPDSYENWVGKLDLTCASGTKMGFIASAYFIGWISTLLFLPRLSDLYGRQKFLMIGNIVATFAYAGILFT